MIRKLRTKLVAAAMLSLLAVLTVILGVILLTNYRGIVSDADRILDLLADNQGKFPEIKADFDWEELGPRHRSVELGYETRYFSVLLDRQGTVLATDTGKIAAVDEETAASYAQAVWAQDSPRGFWQDYRYLEAREGENTRVIFLDYGAHLFTFHSTLVTSLWVAASGLLAVLLLLLLLSRRIIKPVIEGHEKQKRFITDAGHEIKTPIAIIQADTEVLALETGEENEWIVDIQTQIKRLSTLTNDLIYLSRMEEEQPKLQYIDFPISDVVEEMAQSFAAPARSQDKDFQVQVQPMLSFKGDEKGIRQLVSILLDNALKYSPPGGQLALRLEKQGRNLLLTVSNTCAQLMEQDKLPHLFDRFYRTDQSRNSQSGGYGLGLSIAKSIVSAHKGKIRAESPDGTQLTIQVTLAAG